MSKVDGSYQHSKDVTTTGLNFLRAVGPVVKLLQSNKGILGESVMRNLEQHAKVA